MARTLQWMLILAVALLTPLSAIAQDEEEEVGRGVARISVINGDVSVQRGDSGEWVDAAVNAPLVVPDSLFSSAGSRAEVQLDWANMVRLAPNTEVRFSELEENSYQVQIARGTITFSVLRDSTADVDLSAPNVSVRPLDIGSYRIAVMPDGTTEITVREGEAEIYTPAGTEYLEEGTTMLVRGPVDEPEFQLIAEIPRDDWDQWNVQRDDELKDSGAYRYAHRSIYGLEDLDGYGSWVHVAPYGWVWSPQVAVGWSPYRYGRWSWIDWYGWSWVSYDPWGWAPYHYGRWFHNGPHGWCWWPGQFRRHHWSPGLVAFFGWGNGGGLHVGVGVGFGHVGWVPLAPYERYHPWYGHRYYGRPHDVNIINNVNVANVYRNARVHDGITAVQGDRFGRGRVHNVYDGNLRDANLVRGQLPVAPGRDSIRYANRADGRVARPASNGPTNFYSRRQASRVERVPFDQQRQGMEQVVRRASSPGSGNQGRSASTASPTREASGTDRSPAATRGASGNAASRSRDNGTTSGPADRQSSGTSNGWQRVSPSDSTTQSTTRTRPATGASSQGGWSRFGEPSRTQSGSSGSSAETSRSETGASRSRTPSSNSRSTGTTRSSESDSSGWRSFGRSGSSPSRPSVVNRSGQSTDSTSSSTNRSNRNSTAPRSTTVSPSRSSGSSVRTPSSRSSSRSSTPSVRTPSRSSTPSVRTPSRSSSPSVRTPSRTSRPAVRAPSSRSSSRPSSSSMRAPSSRSSGGVRSAPSRSSGSSAAPSSRGSSSSGSSSRGVRRR